MRKAAALLLGVLLLAPGLAGAAANDTWYSEQWGLHRIRAAEAWQITRGQGSIVAVVDTGVDPDHPDLQGRLMRGRDFVDGGRDARDRNGHGTLIAGIIAATTNNGIGVASVAPRARILPVRVLDDDGTGRSSDVAAGIRWAVDRGAHVINLSLAQERSGGGGGLLGSDLLRDPSVGNAIEDAARAGATVVIAAGNDRSGGQNRTAYDAQVPGAIVVGASTREDRRAAYSNYGSGLDVLAPGGGSPTDPSEAGCTQTNSIVSTWYDPSGGGARYGGGCGTSMAVAFVSGLAALLQAQGYDNAGAVRRMIRTADDLGPAGWDSRTGHGRINAARALRARAATSSPTPTPAPPAPAPTHTPDVTAQANREDAASPSPSPTASPSPAQPEPSPGPMSEPPPPVAFPRGDVPEPMGWPVTLAAALVCALVLGHTIRFLATAPPRR